MSPKLHFIAINLGFLSSALMILASDSIQIVYPQHACLYGNRGPGEVVDWGLFYEYICTLLSAWHAFRIIYEQGVLSPQSFKEKADAMGREIVVFFQSHGSDAQESEVAGFLIQVLSEDFNTDLDDDSDLAVARWIVDGYVYLSHENDSLLQELRASNIELLPGFGGTQPPIMRLTSVPHTADDDIAKYCLPSAAPASVPTLDDEDLEYDDGSANSYYDIYDDHSACEPNLAWEYDY